MLREGIALEDVKRELEEIGKRKVELEGMQPDEEDPTREDHSTTPRISLGNGSGVCDLLLDFFRWIRLGEKNENSEQKRAKKK